MTDRFPNGILLAGILAVIFGLLLLSGPAGCGTMRTRVQAATAYTIVSQSQESHPNVAVWQLELGTAPLPAVYKGEFALTSPISAQEIGLSWRTRGCGLVLAGFRDQNGVPLTLPVIIEGDQNQTYNIPERDQNITGIEVDVQSTVACQFEYVLFVEGN